MVFYITFRYVMQNSFRYLKVISEIPGTSVIFTDLVPFCRLLMRPLQLHFWSSSPLWEMLHLVSSLSLFRSWPFVCCLGLLRSSFFRTRPSPLFFYGWLSPHTLPLKVVEHFFFLPPVGSMVPHQHTFSRQLPGALYCPFSSDRLQISCLRPFNPESIRQFHDGFLHKPPGQDSFRVPLQPHVGSLVLVSSAGHLPLSISCPRGGQPFGRFPF